MLMSKGLGIFPLVQTEKQHWKVSRYLVKRNLSYTWAVCLALSPFYALSIK